ncbi:MAG: SDR family NAD(P)-dependent oxidoreductase [Microthrixaceae bacterium]
MTDRGAGGTNPPAIEPSGAVAVVTGGASGIGRAIAAALLGRGARVVIGRRRGAALERTVGELGSATLERQGTRTGGRGHRRLRRGIHRRAGRPGVLRPGGCDLLFLNAGVTSGAGVCPGNRSPTTGAGASA